MNVTQPLTLIRVEMPGSMPLRETWKSAMPTLPLHVHPGADGPVHEGDPADQEQQHAQVEGEAGRPGPRTCRLGDRDWPTGGASGAGARVAVTSSGASPATTHPFPVHRLLRRPGLPVPVGLVVRAGPTGYQPGAFGAAPPAAQSAPDGPTGGALPRLLRPFITSEESPSRPPQALAGSLAVWRRNPGIPTKTLTDAELTALALAADP